MVDKVRQYKIRGSGNGLSLSIPSEIIKFLKWRINQSVRWQILIDENSVITGLVYINDQAESKTLSQFMDDINTSKYRYQPKKMKEYWKEHNTPIMMVGSFIENNKDELLDNLGYRHEKGKKQMVARGVFYNIKDIYTKKRYKNNSSDKFVTKHEAGEEIDPGSISELEENIDYMRDSIALHKKEFGDMIARQEKILNEQEEKLKENKTRLKTKR